MKTTQEPMVYRKKLEVQFGVSGDITSCISCNHDVEDYICMTYKIVLRLHIIAFTY